MLLCPYSLLGKLYILWFYTFIVLVINKVSNYNTIKMCSYSLVQRFSYLSLPFVTTLHKMNNYCVRWPKSNRNQKQGWHAAKPLLSKWSKFSWLIVDTLNNFLKLSTNFQHTSMNFFDSSTLEKTCQKL